MCGIAGVYALGGAPIPDVDSELAAMSHLIRHRGPDGDAIWRGPSDRVGFAHRRLEIIDLVSGNQPMTDPAGNWITYNGEIYNYVELREELGADNFRTDLGHRSHPGAYRRWGRGCVDHLRGMFAFAIWDPRRRPLFCARDRFGMKPFYYAIVDGRLLLRVRGQGAAAVPAEDGDRSRGPARLPDLPVLPGRARRSSRESVSCRRVTGSSCATVQSRSSRYWDVYYRARLRARPAGTSRSGCASCSPTRCGVHLRADVPVGAYISGGLDSSIVASTRGRPAARELLASMASSRSVRSTTRARTHATLARHKGIELHELDITVVRFHRPASAASSTTSTIRSPGPAPSRSSWSRSLRGATGRWSSAGRAGTRCSAGTRAIWSRTSSSVSGRRSTARCTTATSWSPTSRSCPT